MNLTISKSDTLGMLAGTLCMLHCFATPFLFIAVAGIANSGEEALYGGLLLTIYSWPFLFLL